MRRVSHIIRFVLITGLAVSLGAGALRAAQDKKYQAKLQELQKQWADQQKQAGLSPSNSEQRKKLYALHSSPEVKLATVAAVRPGASTKISGSGTFGEKTVFLLEHDAVELADLQVRSGSFTGTVTVAPDTFPGFVRLHAFTPVSGASDSLAALFIAAVESFDFRAGNGWIIKAIPQASAFTVRENDAVLPYKVDFYKPGEPKPFETREANLTLLTSSEPGGPLSLSLTASAGGAMAELQAMQNKMADPQSFLKMSEKEQEAFMARMEKLTEQMQQEMMASMSNPAEMQRKEDQFGCRSLTVSPDTGANVTGSVTCGKNVGTLTLTGTMTPKK